ncbi:ABC transporter substrate-binding protein [Embleya sp. NPDC005971]|uniref:ABC transporter substrate-binding protein n=1 Tax=Embleya sp. NPDC005971 TaxID=3156724 RepID=UPI0033FC0D00
MASTSAGRRGTRRRAAAGLLVVPLLLAVGCSRSGDDAVAKGPQAAGNPAAPGSTKDGKPAAGGAPGDFGTLKDVCGKGDGKPLTKKADRGVTEKEISVSVTGDPGAAAQPGLGKEFFEMADGFTKWCNELGGINGRTIKLTKRDAALSNVGTVMTAACQSDFMVVGGGNPFDNDGVKARTGCKLGAFPAYVVGEESAKGDLQDLAVGLPTSTTVVGAYKAVFAAHPEVKAKVGLLGQAIASLRPSMVRYKAGVEAAGGTVVYKEDVPVIPPPGRTTLEKMKEAGVEMLITTWLAVDSASMFREMDAMNWHPKVIVSDASAYNRYTLASAKNSQMPETYIYPTFVPQSLGDKNPAVQKALEILHSVEPKKDLEFFHMSGINSWLLWASAVKECGTDLTTECVLAKGKRANWDAGGLFAPGPIVETKDVRAADCFTMLKVSPKGFEYDAALTKPNKAEYFNCDPSNVVAVAPGAPAAQNTPPPSAGTPPPAGAPETNTPPPADGGEPPPAAPPENVT